MIQKFLFLLLPFVFHLGDTAIDPKEGVLHLQVSNIQKPEGIIWIGVYDSKENFLIKEKAIVKGVEIGETGTIEMTVENVKFGDCAVAIFHDINGNGEMDRSWLGVPIEPYAFSRKPRSKWRLPRFNEVVIDFAPRSTKLSVELKRW